MISRYFFVAVMGAAIAFGISSMISVILNEDRTCRWTQALAWVFAVIGVLIACFVK